MSGDGHAGSGTQRSRLPVLEELADVVDMVRHQPGLYLRYSEGLASDISDGPSRDYEADVELPGWSVTTIDPEPWWTRPDRDWIARRLCKYADLGEEQNRFPWLLTGREVGRGPDHEPVVVDMEPVARIGSKALEQAQTLYWTRFETGRDSRS